MLQLQSLQLHNLIAVSWALLTFVREGAVRRLLLVLKCVHCKPCICGHDIFGLKHGSLKIMVSCQLNRLET